MKNTKKYAGLVAILALSLLPLSSQAREEHGAHVHGIGTLNVAMDGQQLELALETPTMNVLGFEHAPFNQEELDKAKGVLEDLKQGETVITLPAAAGCTLASSDVKTSMELTIHDESEEEHHHDGHEHDGHDHDAHIDGEHHHDAADADHDHEEHEGEHEHHHHHHSDIDADYHYTCTAPQKLDGFRVNLFDHYLGFNTVKLQFISKTKQDAADLTPKNPEFSLK